MQKRTRIGLVAIAALCLIVFAIPMGAYATASAEKDRCEIVVTVSSDQGECETGLVTVHAKDASKLTLSGTISANYRYDTPNILARMLLDQLGVEEGTEDVQLVLAEEVALLGGNAAESNRPGKYVVVFEKNGEPDEVLSAAVLLWDETVNAQDFDVDEQTVASMGMEAYIERAQATALFVDGSTPGGERETVREADFSAVLAEPGRYEVSYISAHGTVATGWVTVVEGGGALATVRLDDSAVPLSGPDEAAGEAEPDPVAMEAEGFEFPVVEDEPMPQTEPESETEPQVVTTTTAATEAPVTTTVHVVEEKPAAVEDKNQQPQPEAPQAENAPETAEPEAKTDEIIEYMVTFQNEDESVFLSVKVREEQSVARPLMMPSVDENHAFAHWYDVRGGEETAYDFNKPITENLTLRAYFIELVADEEAPDDDALVEDTDVPGDAEEAQSEDTDMNIIGAMEDTLEGELIYIIPTPEDEEEAADGDAETAEEVETAAGAAPTATIEYDFEGEFTLGTLVTLYARLENVPENAQVEFQWQNDSSGVYTDVPGATMQSYTFPVTQEVAGCHWRVMLIVHETEMSEDK